MWDLFLGQLSVTFPQGDKIIGCWVDPWCDVEILIVRNNWFHCGLLARLSAVTYEITYKKNVLYFALCL